MHFPQDSLQFWPNAPSSHSVNINYKTKNIQVQLSGEGENASCIVLFFIKVCRLQRKNILLFFAYCLSPKEWADILEMLTLSGDWSNFRNLWDRSKIVQNMKLQLVMNLQEI